MPGKEDREGVASVPTVNDPILACGAQCFLMSNFLEMKKAAVQSQGGSNGGKHASTTCCLLVGYSYFSGTFLKLLAMRYCSTRLDGGDFVVDSYLQSYEKIDAASTSFIIRDHSIYSMSLPILPYVFGFHHSPPQRRQEPPVAQPAQPAQPAAAPTPVPTVLLLREGLEAMAQQEFAVLPGENRFKAGGFL